MVAKTGDGVFTLLRRHGLNPSEHLAPFLELNKDNLGKDNSLLIGKTYMLPPKVAATGKETPPETTRSEPNPSVPNSPSKGNTVALFGEKHARLDMKSQRLKGAVYYLSPGHGGYDPGALGRYGPHTLAEDEYAYDVTIRLAKSLMEHGATVYMIVQDPNDGIRDQTILKMDTDEVHYPNTKISLSQKQRLRQRTEAINTLYKKHKGAYQRMLAIHVDSRSIGQKIDVFFYHHENSDAGQKLAETIHQKFTSKYKRYQPNREYSGNVSHRSSLYVIKYTHPPTVFIELGNIQNDLDQKRFVIPDNRQALANWIAEGILDDYKTR
ncbi:N-acetylmuramoyl-L-alanine amidase family protein [Pontibacter arcticus]|uniref:N-acetylmuramoyl-L-alanine amidase family protein n=1 Tax=Pontibacter arcticus TaxID=2080288 RepID=UPI001EEFE8B7|nr:N-acetylmuramoyl-L-alanine amidase [Pontibacter arcticus]